MGHVLDAVGPVNQSMAGAGTALPLDSLGALHWNPASITGLQGSEIGFSMAAFAPDLDLASSDPFGNYGRTSSDTDIDPMPAFGFVYSPKDSPWAYGFGGFAVAGFGVDYSADPTNPILGRPGGFGALYSSYQMMQVNLTLACRVTDRLSLGIAPTINWSSLAVDPFPGFPPDPPAGPGLPGHYLNAAHADSRWGLGLQFGFFYEMDNDWNIGGSYKTTQWMQEYAWNSIHADGTAETVRFNMDYPAILSMGLGYTGLKFVDLAFDVRYIDYENTDGFSETGFGPHGDVKGFGWSSIWTFALGAQFHVTERFHLRAGYGYNENAVPADVGFFNVPAPAIIQHHLNTGFSWDGPHGLSLAFAYHHGFHNGIRTEMVNPGDGQPIPGSTVTSSMATHSMTAAIYKKY